MPRRRVFLYVQSLSGTGHYVRMYEIARALAPFHDVLLLDGGRPIPRPPAPVPRLVVPGIYRDTGGDLAAVDGRPIDLVLAERRAALAAALDELRPDVVLVEDYPFSKWEMDAEIRGVLERARRAGPALVCSCLRDIGTRKRRRVDGDDFPGRVKERLRAAFDRVLVHADPAVVRVEEHLPWAADLPVPVVYTGYVSQPAPARPPADPTRVQVVVSTGGAAANSLIPLAIQAWGRLGLRGELTVFLPAFASAGELATWRAEEPGVRFAPFSADFLDTLAAADVSVSHAGYNTCVNLLAAGTPAVLVPNPGMGDQVHRAALLERLGLAAALDLETASPDDLARAIRSRLDAPPPAHAIDLSGAETVRAILET